MSSKKAKTQSADMLLNKRDELLKCVADFEQTVSLVTRMVNGLEQTNVKILEAIKEIEDYQSELEQTKSSFEDAKNQNERVVKNFKVLLGSEN